MHNFLSLSIPLRRGHARRAALLLGLNGLAAGASGQSFGPVSNYAAGASSLAKSVVLGDVNSDGRPDIVTANGFSNTVSVLLGQAGGFAAAVTYSTGPGSTPQSAALIDINQDGQLDIVTANISSGSLGYLLGTGSGGFGAVTYGYFGPNARPNKLVVRDMNRDGRPDLVVAIAGMDVVAVGTVQAGGGIGNSTATPSGGSGVSGVAVGDLNADGWPDMVTTNSGPNPPASGSVVVQLARGGIVAFAPPTSYYPGNDPADVALGDVNADGRLDIVTANAASNTVAVLQGQAGGGFAAPVPYAIGANTSPRSVALGDVNGDGRLDIVTANSGSNTVAVLLGQAGGNFAAVIGYSTGPASAPQWVALSDVNGDRRLDIVTANQSSYSVGVLLNTGTYTPLAAAPALAAAADLAHYPNPAHDAFTVQLPAAFASGPVQAELLNALGQAVGRPVVTGPSFRVETSGLAPGLYTLRLHAGGSVLARRVAVE